MSTSAKRVAMVLAPNFEDVEATEPKDALEQAGATVTVIGIETGPIQGKKGATLEATETFSSVSPDDFDMLVIPGGGSPENLRINDAAVSFTKSFVESGKPVGSICHGPQLLISANAVRGRTITCWPSIAIDVKNAGGLYVDKPVVIDGPVITSRKPDDIPFFSDAVIAALAR
jgi:protease I